MSKKETSMKNQDARFLYKTSWNRAWKTTEYKKRKKFIRKIKKDIELRVCWKVQYRIRIEGKSKEGNHTKEILKNSSKKHCWGKAKAMIKNINRLVYQLYFINDT